MSTTYPPTIPDWHDVPESDYTLDRLLRGFNELQMEVRALRALLAPLVTDVARASTPPSLDGMGDVLTRADIARLAGYKPRHFERWVTLQNKTGESLLPPEIEGMRGRYRKTDVERWLKSRALHGRTLTPR